MDPMIFITCLAASFFVALAIGKIQDEFIRNEVI